MSSQQKKPRKITEKWLQSRLARLELKDQPTELQQKRMDQIKRMLARIEAKKQKTANA